MIALRPGLCVLLTAAALLAGCDGRQSAPAATAAPSAATPAPSAAPAAAATAAAEPPAASPAAPRAVAAAPVAAAGNPQAARTREVVNPDDRTMVLLYLDLAGIDTLPEDWIEGDRRVQSARPADKQAQRELVRAEFKAARAAVHDIGQLRLSTGNAQVSDYDPGYQEFTVGALSPASQFTWKLLPYQVAVSFTNAVTAQHWQVPAAQAQQMRDRLAGGASLTVLLRITGVQPGVGGGTMLTEVRSYELHARDDSTLARVQVAAGE